jgi:ferredoxin
LKLIVDMDLCHGHARCVGYLPEVLDSDDLGYAVVLNDGVVPEGLEPKAAQAVRNCPERAITMVEG